MDHVAAQGKSETLRDGSRYGSKGNVEKGHWLFPIEDRRDQNDKGLAGLILSVSLFGYLQLVDWSSRLIRPGTVSLPDPVPDILTRLQIDSVDWKITLEKLVGSAKTIGSYFGNQ